MLRIFHNNSFHLNYFIEISHKSATAKYKSLINRNTKHKCTRRRADIEIEKYFNRKIPATVHDAKITPPHQKSTTKIPHFAIISSRQFFLLVDTFQVKFASGTRPLFPDV